MEKFIFPIADGTVKIFGEEQDLRRSTSIQDRPDRGEEQGNLQGDSDGSSSTPLRDSSWYDGEAWNDFWSISGDFIYRHHVEHRVKLYVPTEESFPLPLKYIDVTGTTNTTFDGQEMGPQGVFKTGGGGLVRVPNLRVCKHLVVGWHRRRRRTN